MAYIYLTVTLINETEINILFIGHNDPIILCGRVIA